MIQCLWMDRCNSLTDDAFKNLHKIIIDYKSFIEYADIECFEKYYLFIYYYSTRKYAWMIFFLDCSSITCQICERNKSVLLQKVLRKFLKFISGFGGNLLMVWSAFSSASINKMVKFHRKIRKPEQVRNEELEFCTTL